MPRPGVDVRITEAAPVGGAVLNTGQAFFLGQAERGPTDQPYRVRSQRTYERVFGERIGGAVLYDSVRAFFQEGGSTAYVLRVTGANASPAQATAIGPLKAVAQSPGKWGNKLKVGIEGASPLIEGAIQMIHHDLEPQSGKSKKSEENPPIAGAQEDPEIPLRVTVEYDDEIVERSTPVQTAEQAVAWSAFSAFVTLTAENPQAELAATAAKALAGGSDDTNVTSQVVTGALERLPFALGPGQVCYPGATDLGTHTAILDHCDTNRRCALLDVDDTDATTIAASVVLLYGKTGRWAQALAPRHRYPGPAGLTVTTPYSGIQAGIIARRDAQTQNPNAPAAGADGISNQSRGLAREFTDDEREQLNEAGATLAKVRFGTVRTYGSRTAAGPGDTNWMWFGGSRVVMAIAHEGDAIGEQFVHKQIDGQGKIFLALRSALTAVCDRYYNLGALYGEEAEDAYLVDTSSAVNTIDTIAAGEMHATIRLKTSPSAEWVLIEISKRPVQETAAA